MIKIIAILSGAPNSINSEIIAKTWKKLKLTEKKKLLIIGNYEIFKKQISKIGITIPLENITSVKKHINENKLNILNIPLKFRNIFKVNINETKKYIYNSLDVAHHLAYDKSIQGFINSPIDKKIFNNQYLGVTEYLAAKNKMKEKEVMMIYNSEMAVVPLTTHLEIKNVTNKINFNLIKNKILTLNKFYFKLLKKKPKILMLGLNPHNSENRINSIENKIIKPAVNKLKKIGINIIGPFPADTAFTKIKDYNCNVVVGMYHDQVLAPFKALYGYNAINITLGLKYLRLSPDHGTANDIVGLNKANPQSLINAVRFLNKFND